MFPVSIFSIEDYKCTVPQSSDCPNIILCRRRLDESLPCIIFSSSLLLFWVFFPSFSDRVRQLLLVRVGEIVGIPASFSKAAVPLLKVSTNVESFVSSANLASSRATSTKPAARSPLPPSPIGDNHGGASSVISDLRRSLYV